MMTDERLDEIKKRCEEASPGPWVWVADIEGRLADVMEVAKEEPWLASGVQPLGQPWVLQNSLESPTGKAVFRKSTPMVLDYADCGSHACLSSVQDRRFIAHARQDIPDLLEEIERLKKRVDTLEDMIKP